MLVGFEVTGYKQKSCILGLGLKLADVDVSEIQMLQSCLPGLLQNSDRKGFSICGWSAPDHHAQEELQPSETLHQGPLWMWRHHHLPGSELDP